MRSGLTGKGTRHFDPETGLERDQPVPVTLDEPGVTKLEFCNEGQTLLYLSQGVRSLRFLDAATGELRGKVNSVKPPNIMVRISPRGAPCRPRSATTRSAYGAPRRANPSARRSGSNRWWERPAPPGSSRTDAADPGSPRRTALGMLRAVAGHTGASMPQKAYLTEFNSKGGSSSRSGTTTWRESAIRRGT